MPFKLPRVVRFVSAAWEISFSWLVAMARRMVSIARVVTTIASILTAKRTSTMTCTLTIKRTSDLLDTNRFHSLLLVEFFYRLPFGFFFADEYPVKMSDFPKLRIYRLARSIDQFEFWEELFVVFSVFKVVLKKVHGFFDLNAKFLQWFRKRIQLNQPLVSVGNLPFAILGANSTFEVKPIHVIIRCFELCCFEPHWKIFISVDPASVALLDTFFIYFFQNWVAIGDCCYKHAANQQVREDWA